MGRRNRQSLGFVIQSLDLEKKRQMELSVRSVAPVERTSMAISHSQTLASLGNCSMRNVPSDVPPRVPVVIIFFGLALSHETAKMVMAVDEAEHVCSLFTSLIFDDRTASPGGDA